MLLLVAPDGKGTVLLYKPCGDEDVTGPEHQVRRQPSQLGDVSCPGSYYLPTDGSPFDDFPGTSNGPVAVPP